MYFCFYIITGFVFISFNSVLVHCHFKIKLIEADVMHDAFDLMRNLYIYNACIYIYSISLTGMDGAAGGQILSPRLFITQ